MTLEQIFLSDLDLKGTDLTITGSEFHHLRTVRRFKVGEQVMAVDGKGHARILTLLEIGRDTVIASAAAPRTGLGESLIPITLAIGNLKSDHLEWVVEKATELGVTRIVPLLTEHTIKQSIRRDRLERIAVSAVKQSARSQLPEIWNLTSPVEARRHSGDAKHWFCMQTEKARPVFTVARGAFPPNLWIWVGPEGDWSESEIEMARRNEFLFIHLGPRRLRSETAAISVLSGAAQWIDAAI